MAKEPSIEEVSHAILDAYPNYADLRSLLMNKGGLRIEWEVSTLNSPYRIIAENVADLYRSRGELRRLIEMLAAERQHNPRIRTLAAAVGLTPEVAAVSLSDQLPAKPANLEAMVHRRSRLVDMARFRERLDRTAPRLCMVETPARTGTGFLIGTSAVLTNYHVVEEAVGGTIAPDRIVCRFDHDGGGAEHRVGVAGSIDHWSAYDPSDLTGNGRPQVDKLDYAILSLADPIGAAKGPDGNARGWITLDRLPRIVVVNDFMIICQHPSAREQELAIGVVVAAPEALRLRYDVTTEEGSSGSPCFNAELEPVGLHHAADPGVNPTYNQAIPLWLVAKDAIAKGFAPEVGA